MTTQIPADSEAAEKELPDDDAVDDDEDLFDDAGLPEQRASARAMGWLLLIAGIIGLAGSAALTIERILLLEDPGHTPSCSFNPIVTCGTVMQSWQGELFGFPNPLLGIATFPVVMTFGVMLLAGLRPPRWMWLAFWGGTLFGAAFVTWLFTQSVYVIGALCPYCMVVWVAMIPTFVYATGYVLSERHLPAPAGLRRAIVENRSLISIVWLLGIAIFITVEFWDRWHLVF